MLLQTLRHEIMRCVPMKCNIYPISSCLYFQRSKSVAVLPDSVPILKPIPRSSSTAALRIKTINKVMKAYLERSKKHGDFLKVKNDEFEIGRQHLANMMGLEAATMTQEDIDRAIQYLLPSGLYEKNARPMMKPPEKLYPKEKAAQFDNSGRPFSAFFYTSKANYYSTLHKLSAKFYELDAFEDKMIAKGILQPPKDAIFVLPGGVWKNQEEVSNLFLEKITEAEHKFLVDTLDRLSKHPYAFRCKDDITAFHNQFTDMGLTESIPEPLKDADGRLYIEMRGKRIQTTAKVTVRQPGTGKVSINGLDILFFEHLHDREQVMYPLEFTDLLGKVDFEADISGKGNKCMAGAVRHGLAMCLRSFVSPDMVDKMRLAGMLQEDLRRRGRKMYGQKGVRAKFTWKKR